jgi:glycosyltransferase involved in cell wall biosynthesis
MTRQASGTSLKKYHIGILTTHPIQYQVPWFQALAARPEVDLSVFFCMIPDASQQGDGFGVAFQWDVPLLEGYRYQVLENVARNPSVTRFNGCDTPGIYGIVKEGAFDAFIVNGWVVRSCLQLLYACRKYKVPCIVRGEANALRQRPWWKRMLHHQLMAKYAAFLSIGEANRRFYLQNGVPSGKIFFAPYCIDNERFALRAEQLRPERGASRSRWEIPADAFTFVFSGKLIEKKHPMDLLWALDLVVNRGDLNPKKLHVLMVGDGELRGECGRYASAKRLPVSFAGFLNQGEIPAAYVASDCLVLPSDYGETWGLVVNEAMACGLPAILSDRVGCAEDLIQEGITGKIFPFGNVEALSRLLVELMSDRNKVELMGREANKLIKKFCYDDIIRSTLAALALVCNRRSKG